MDILITVAAIAAVAVVVLAWWARVDPPDDPWMLDNGHRLTRHWLGPEDAPWDRADEALQQRAAERRKQRDAEMEGVNRRHVSPARRLREVG